MREWLAFTCGKIFIFWFNLCALLDLNMAFDLLDAMQGARKTALTQQNYTDALHKK